jgi:hypothetical protein
MPLDVGSIRRAHWPKERIPRSRLSRGRWLTMSAVQLKLPYLGGLSSRAPLCSALVEVVEDHGRLRVRPLARPGWVKFPRALRVLGAVYRVEKLLPRPGGAWTASGRIRRVVAKSR